RAVQARALADSGVQYTAAILSDRDSFQGTLGSAPYHNEGAFRDVVVQEDPDPTKLGRFSVLSPPDPDDQLAGSTTFRFGVTDEGGKININALIKLDPTGKVLNDMLVKLPDMTADVAAAIVDWVDADDQTRENGAESDFYGSYRCKNNPLDSL